LDSLKKKLQLLTDPQTPAPLVHRVFVYPSHQLLRLLSIVQQMQIGSSVSQPSEDRMNLEAAAIGVKLYRWVSLNMRARAYEHLFSLTCGILEHAASLNNTAVDYEIARKAWNELCELAKGRPQLFSSLVSSIPKFANKLPKSMKNQEYSRKLVTSDLLPYIMANLKGQSYLPSGQSSIEETRQHVLCILTAEPVTESTN
jgi:hypothetical protein